MILGRFQSRALLAAVAGVAIPTLGVVALGLMAAHDKSAYDLIKDLFVPLAGPLVAVLIPVAVLAILPAGQTRNKLALDLCTAYYQEEMREARNVAWQHFVTEQRALPPMRRAERLHEFIDYLTSPEVHRGIDPKIDAIYQKTQRVLDYFGLVNGCLARSTADPDLVRDFLFYYYLWWRDEIMEPLRKTRRVADNAVGVRPVWWPGLPYLDALAPNPGRLP